MAQKIALGTFLQKVRKSFPWDTKPDVVIQRNVDSRFKDLFRKDNNENGWTQYIIHDDTSIYRIYKKHLRR